MLKTIHGIKYTQYPQKSIQMLNGGFSLYGEPFRIQLSPMRKRRYIIEIDIPIKGNCVYTNEIDWDTAVSITTFLRGLYEDFTREANPAGEAKFFYNACKYLENYCEDITRYVYFSNSFYSSLNEYKKDTAQTWLEWYKAQYDENPMTTVLLTAAAAGAIGYGAYWAYHKYLYPPQEQEQLLLDADEFQEDRPADDMAEAELQAEFDPEFDDEVDFPEEEFVAALDDVLENDEGPLNLDDDDEHQFFPPDDANQDEILNLLREPQVAFEEQQQSILYSELLGRLGAFQNVAEHLEQASKGTDSHVSNCLSVFN